MNLTVQVPWTLRDLFWAIVIAAGGIVALNAAVLVLNGLLQISISQNNTALMLLVIVQDAIIVGAAWTFSVLRYRIGWEQVGLRRFDAAFGCLFSFALLGLSYFIRICYVVTAMALGWRLQPQEVIFRMDVSGWNFFLTFFSVAIVAPLTEEIFFRGFLYAGLRARLGVPSAMLISTLFFTTLHFSVDAFVPIFVLGVFLAWVYEKTGSLYPGILLHAANNGIALIVLALAQALGMPLSF
jgi:membrane protease YdiL (CAAX protease family)